MYNFLFSKLLTSTLVILLFCSSIANSQCEITDLTVTVSECDENDKFSAEINFNFDETGANGFQILGNGNNYGTFQYGDLPIIIEDLTGNCELEYEFIIRDIDDPTCAEFIDYGTVCCDDVCAISIFDFETTECSDDFSFGISLNLEFEFVGDNGYSVSINEDNYGDYSYEELPLNIDDITSTGAGINTITICDIDNPDCCESFSFLNPCVCGMTNITTEIVDCNSDDTTYFAIINFDYIATNDSFQMGYSNEGTNVFLGTFAYDDLPVTAGPIFLSDNEQEILIVDTDDFFCFSSAYLGIVDDCNIECQLFNVFAEAYMCEEGVYFMDVEFEAKDIVGSTFDILVDAISYGTFQYGENVYTIGPIPSNCDLAPTVVVQDSGEGLCSDFFNLDEPVCCLPDCNFISFDATADCGTSMLTVNGIFENNGAMLSGFYFVEFLGTSYGPFSYGDFMFSIQVPLLADGEYEITINDSLDPECQISTTVIVQCEVQPCTIFNVFAEASECEDGVFFVDVEFEFAGEVSDSFEILGNGMNYGIFAYGEQFYTVGPLEGDCETLYEFVVSDQIFEGCNSFYGFEEPVCCMSECMLRDLAVVDHTCANVNLISGFTLDFIFENNPSDMFSMDIDGVIIGSYLYSDLPIQFLIDLPKDFTIIVFDAENEDCQTSEFIELDCSELECTISNVEVEFIECIDDNRYLGNLNFDFINTSDSFIVSVGTISDTVSYSDLPYQLGPLLVGIAQIVTIFDSEGNCVGQEITLFEDCETSLKEADFSNIEIIHANNTITIINNEAEEMKFQLYSTTGALIKKIDIGVNFTDSFDTSGLPAGLYFMNISNSKSQQTVKMVVF